MKEEILLEKIDTNKLAEEIKERAQQATNEEELRISFAEIFNPILRNWNIKFSYEKKAPRYIVSGVRKDALYGTVILEFKGPGKLKNKKFKKAKEQVKKYIKIEAVDPRYYGRYFGVLTDGFNIAFIRFRKGEWEEQDKPLEINAQTVLRLLEAIRGLRRKPIESQLLLEDFGPKSEISRKTILALYKTLINSESPRTEMLSEDWKRVFSQVCAYSEEKLKGLVNYYGLKDHEIIDVEKLMFAIHTYYTILMKLLTSEVVTLFADSLIGSYLKRLEEGYLKSKEDMFNELKELEEGGIFAEVGIKNFLEADYFAWYLDEWNDEIARLIYEIVEKLLDYEPATVELSPERVKDLFKRLYQNLVSRDIRHKLGEYYTPDWLADLLLDEVGYDGNPNKRLLDPACGSGTFLILAIKRIREYAEEHFLDKRELIRNIIKNVRGIDLNPLAVLASKANYIIALSDLLRYRPKDGIEIPIYLADSISVERTMTLYGEKEFTLHTTQGKFWITKEVIDKNLLYPVLSLIDECVKLKFTKEEFEKSLSDKIPLTRESIDSFIRLYEKIYKLEYMYHKNRIWTSLLKNSFAPMLMGKFDYVIGNPPWINWETLPKFYRDTTKHFYEQYGLLERTKGMGMGKVKRDIAMLFVARCFDLYVKEGGQLAFLVPFTTYKTQAGAGFRKFLANKCEVEKIHDLVELYPFEGAVNRTSMLVIKEGKTKFPIPCVMWSNPRSKGMDMEATLEEVKKTTRQFDMILTPIKEGKAETPWMEITSKSKKAIDVIVGESPWYKAFEGINTALNAVYWIDILSKQPNGLLITNPPLPGQKKKVKQVKQVVEKNWVYPLIRGRDVKKWYVVGEYGWIIVPHDSKTGKPLNENEIKIKYPKTYGYFLSFKNDLEKRSIHKLWGKNNPFYSVYDIGDYTFYPYKVVWKRIAGAITGKAVSFVSTVIEPIEDKYLEGLKPIVLNDSLILIPFDDEKEAYYVSGVLNSSPVLFTIASYTYELRMETHITRYIKIPPFDSQNPLHQKLSKLSKKAHKIAKQIYEEDREDLKEDLKKIEEEIDKTVAKLYGITDEELKEIRKCLMILKEGEIPEEEEESEEEQQIVLPKKDIEIKVNPLLIEENKQQELTVSVQNNTNKPIKDVKLEVKLKSKSLLTKTIREVRPNDSVSLKFTVPKLKGGEYELEINFSSQDVKFKESRKLFVREKKKAKKTKSSLDDELERLLG